MRSHLGYLFVDTAQTSCFILTILTLGRGHLFHNEPLDQRRSTNFLTGAQVSTPLYVVFLLSCTLTVLHVVSAISDLSLAICAPRKTKSSSTKSFSAEEYSRRPYVGAQMPRVQKITYQTDRSDPVEENIWGYEESILDRSHLLPASVHGWGNDQLDASKSGTAVVSLPVSGINQEHRRDVSSPTQAPRLNTLQQMRDFWPMKCRPGSPHSAKTGLSTVTEVSSVYSESSPSLNTTRKKQEAKKKGYGQLRSKWTDGTDAKENDRMTSTGTVSAAMLDATGSSALGEFGFSPPSPPRLKGYTPCETSDREGRIVSATSAWINHKGIEQSRPYGTQGPSTRERREGSSRFAEDQGPYNS